MTELRRARLARGLTQTELGDAVGVDQSVLSRLERGERRGHRVTRRALAGALGMPEAELFPDEDPPAE
jgi:transcriptional regulator with XRE-family HTH domain